MCTKPHFQEGESMRTSVRRFRSLRPRQRGFVLVVSALAAVVLIGCLGMAVDLGRMYLIKSEAQNFVDSTALRAAATLDGTTNGILRAASFAPQTSERFDLASRSFTNVRTEFAQTVAGPWYESSSAPSRSRFVRVSTRLQVPMYFMTLVTGSRNGTVFAAGTGAQVEKRTFTEGVFPFSPFAHSKIGPHFGLVPGQFYTLRWPAKPKLGGNICAGDNVQSVIDTAQAAGAEERGFIEASSSDIIRRTIINDYQSVTRTIGDLVDLTGGTKQTQLDALTTRINQDTDNLSQTYSQYQSSGYGNGRRLVAVPINDGGTPLGVNHRIVNIALFFLSPTGKYGNGGAQPWCAQYVGAYVEGSSTKGVEDAGAWVVRLVK